MKAFFLDQTGDFEMSILRITSVVAAVVGMLCVSQSAFAQSTTAMPPHVPLQKTIGQSKPEVVPSLIVLNARGASLQGGKLALKRHYSDFDHLC